MLESLYVLQASMRVQLAIRTHISRGRADVDGDRGGVVGGKVGDVRESILAVPRGSANSVYRHFCLPPLIVRGDGQLTCWWSQVL
jgi:hypothetical protein